MLSTVLNARYGDKITPDNTPVFIFFMAQAMTRMLDNPNTTVISQSTESSSVTYASHTTKGDLFLSAELAQMDLLTGKQSTFLIRATSPKILNR